MAFPYIFHSNFEAGTNAEWDSESDTGGKLSFPHYSTLAAIPGMGLPYSGAFCAWWDLRTGDTNDHTVTEGDIDIATGATRYFRWKMFISNDFAATADDNFSIFELQQAGGTQVYVVGLQIEADDEQLKIWVAENSTPETVSGNTLPKGRWFVVEVIANVDTAAANGDISVNIDGSEWVSLTTTVQNAAAIGTGVLGTQNTLSTTTGSILIDDFIMDDAQIYPPRTRYPNPVRMLKTGHAFVGPGSIDSITLLSAAGTCSVYDTDVANADDPESKIIELDEAKGLLGHNGPVRFERGCYVVLSSAAYAEVRLPASGGPITYGSDGALRTYASKRIPRPMNV